ncbi:asparaginase [Ideonella alba]|uniref:Asparaginase n=1 Tax=Ideonella alba TaxID=2824118 RepID=A0A941BN37_9BURK|nr:asparaginase [Ideonella alba]MBQ0932914.1 asparaginase [Ideonella alba]
MQSESARIVILGTGGTIAGAGDNVGYAAGSLNVTQLLLAVPALASRTLEAEQVAQLDSKDMDHATWQQLARRAAHHLARPEVAGVVVTHGTDTLEETAWFLQRVLAPVKPLVMTASMRPATSLQADGPQNLLDAVTLAAEPGAQGVLVAVGGEVWAAADVRKTQPFRIDAFEGGDAPPVASLREGRVLRWRDWPRGVALSLETIAPSVAAWPRVGIVSSHAGVEPVLVHALVDAGYRGLVVEGTGNGTVNAALDAALQAAAQRGLQVWRATRCQRGGIVGQPEGAWPSAGALTPAKARVELLLRLLVGR